MKLTRRTALKSLAALPLVAGGEIALSPQLYPYERLIVEMFEALDKWHIEHGYWVKPTNWAEFVYLHRPAEFTSLTRLCYGKRKG